MFEKKKTKEEIEKDKERAKLQKKAEKMKKEQDLKKKQGERILDKNYVEGALQFERQRDEKRQAARDGIIAETEKQILSGEKKTFVCKVCGAEVGLGNMQCSTCGTLYCVYCGFLVPNDESYTGVCPRCGGYQAAGVTPAKLVQTKIEDIPEEERFWEKLNECPACGAATQPDWTECAVCGKKLEAKVAPQPGEESTISSIKEKRKEELLKKRGAQKEAAPKRGI